MIIWGWRGREVEQESGRFHCPQCDCEQDYQFLRVGTYFTLYFIPIFETKHHGDYVKCRGCNGQYKEAVLDYQPPDATTRLVESVRADLANGTPVQMARTKLLNAGLRTETADLLVANAAGDKQRTCASCNLDFVPTISRCSACGASL